MELSKLLDEGDETRWAYCRHCHHVTEQRASHVTPFGSDPGQPHTSWWCKECHLLLEFDGQRVGVETDDQARG
jgi:hypothetical protein